MECGIPLLILALIIGYIVIGYAPDLLVRGFQAVTSSISDSGAFASGCIAGSLSTLLLLLLGERYMSAASECVLIIIIVVAGAITGAIAGVIWALIMDRYVRTCANYGAVGGTIASPISFFVFIFLAMLFFGG